MSQSISKTRNRLSRERSRSLHPTWKERFTIPLSTILAFTVLWIVAVMLLINSRSLRYTGLAVGQQAPSSLIASVNFTCQDVSRTELLQRQAQDRIAPVFDIAAAPLKQHLRDLDAALTSLQDDSESPSTEEIATSQTVSEGTLSLLNTLRPLLPREEQRMLLQTLTNSLVEIWERGIGGEKFSEPGQSSSGMSGVIRIIPSREEMLPFRITVESVPSEEDARNLLIDRIYARAGAVLPRDQLYSLVEPMLAANLRFNSELTESRKKEAFAAVTPVEKEVQAGTTLVEAGERITPQILELLRAHEQKQESLVTRPERIQRISGSAGILLLLLVSSVGLIHILRPELLHTPREAWMLTAASLFSILPSKSLMYFVVGSRLIEPALAEFLIPLAAAPMLLTILSGSAAGLVVGIWTAVTVSALTGFSMTVLLVGLISTVMALLTLQEVRRRSQIFTAGLSIGFALLLLALFTSLMKQYEPSFMIPMAITALLGGLVSSVFVLLLLPLFELAFRHTTDIRLLELSDLGHPLLQRLAIEAPGTYHHSLMVANLAQAAALDTGCNALLTRVCAYFHDVGKLTKPECFIENAQFQQNPHDELSPSMSTLVIISHVKEGISLANHYKLPKPIIEGIQQHHGTSKIAYFYHRALQKQAQANPDGSKDQKVDEQSFRYPGPKPKRAEMGILLLADSIEAASRSMEKPTPSRIETLVNDLVNNKIQDGQLDECSLTFGQLAVIKRSLIFNLTNMLHGRIKYPQDEPPPPESTKPADRESNQAAEPDANPVGESTGL